MLPALSLAVKRLLILALLVASCLAPLQSATLERLSLDDMITKSTTIVRGKVTSSWAALTGSVIYTHYRIQVSESFKGNDKGAVEIMVPGGTVNGLHQNFSGSPLLNQGDEFVFFLWTSNSGITWITGLTQGLFTLPAADVSANRVATRQASRELMLDAATSQSVKDSALSIRLSDLRTRIAATLAAQGGGK
jgi:opacity protein-like surface antigen